MGDTGEPIGVPNICLKYFPRNAKYDDCKQISNPSQTSCIDQFVRSWKSLHSVSLFLAISTAKVVGIFVHNDTTSKNTKISFTETLVSFLLLQQLSEDFYYYLSCWLVLQRVEYIVKEYFAGAGDPNSCNKTV